MSAVTPGQLYRHFKHGTIYEIIGNAIHTETNEEMVIYRDVQTARWFTRPLANFISPARRNNKEVTRFAFIPAETGESK